jgi:hypothetical protein
MKKLIALATLALACLTASAVQPQFSNTTPTGLQRGAEGELRLNGARLDDAQEIILYNTGVQVVKIEQVTNNFVRVRFRVAADCPLGEQKLRIRTASGVSELRTFLISAYPIVEEKEPNSTPDKAQRVPANSTVEGTMQNEDVDYYLIEAKKGQRISAEVEGMRLGRTMFDPYVAIHDKSGKQLIKSDDTPLFVQDCFVTTLAPADGEYLIEVRESSYGGGGNPYRLHIGHFPRPTAVYPAGGQAGQSLDVRFIGDAAGDIKKTVQLPEPSPFRQGVFAEQDGLTAPSANPIRVSDFPNVLEAEPNDDAKSATPTELDLPLAFNGIIEKKGDVDWFRFKAKRGLQFDVNVYARRIRSPLDSVLVLADANGNAIASNDDSGGSDSYVRFNVPNDGYYTLKVTDHLGNGGPDYTYRVEVAPVNQSLQLYIADTARYDTQTRKSIVVARGNRFASMITVRRQNIGGDLELVPENFPAGLKFFADTMPNGQQVVPVVIEADANAPITGRLANIIGKTIRPADAKDFKEVKGGFWQNFDLVQNGNDGVYYATHSDKVFVSVVDELPFKLRIEQPKMALPQSGSMDIKVVAERKAGWEEPIMLRMLYNPPGTGSQPDVTIPKDQPSVNYTLNAGGGATIRKWKLAVLGQASVNGGTAYVSTQLADLDIAEPYVTGRFDITNVTVGGSVKVTCKLEQKRAFDGSAEVTLVGLPAGATTSPVMMTKDSNELVFNVNTATNAQKGVARTLIATAVIKQGAEHITQTVAANGQLRIDAPRVLVAAAQPAATSNKQATPPKKNTTNK